jgi:hypothetical protein
MKTISQIEAEIQKKYSTDEYIKAMQEEITSADLAMLGEMRYHVWMRNREAPLKAIYIKRFQANDADALEMSWLTWSRLQAFIAEYNKLVEETTQKELASMLGNS